MRTAFVVLALLLVLGVAAALEKDRVLVLVGSASIQHTHSKYFSSLQDRGYKLTFSTTENPSQALSEYGNYLFDHLIVFSPHIDEFSGLIDVNLIVDFIDAGHNVLIAADDGVSEPIRQLAAEVGVVFSSKAPAVVDHFVHDVNGEEHERLIVDTQSGMKSILGVDKIQNILFEGTSQSLKSSQVDQGLLFPILNSRVTAFPAPKSNLVSALQARNNARVVISGSLSLFSNAFFDVQIASNDVSIQPTISGNKKFALELTAWNFCERSVLKSSEITHHRIGETIAPAVYTINDNVTVGILIEEYQSGQWVPFQTDNVQVEFIMLDPYVRLTLKPNAQGLHAVNFTIPDVYGVFSFEVNYKKFGYSHIYRRLVAPVRPYMHNEYERFLEAAYPYYAGAFSMIVGVVVLGLIVLYQK